MADEISKVIITGLGNSVPKWASESTLKDIKEEVTLLVNTITKKNEKVAQTKKQSAKNLKEFDDTIDDLIKDQEKQTKEVKKSSDGFTKLTVIGGELKTVFGEMITPLKIFGTAFTVGGVVGGFIDYLKNSSQALLGLYDNGLAFTNSIGELRTAASYAAMPLDEFAQLMVKNSAVVKSFGVNGGKQFGLLTKNTRDLVKAQGYYGLSLSQINEYTAQNLQVLRLTGALSKMSDNDRAASSARYIKELTAYSQVLGKSRAQLDKEVQDALRTPEALATLRTLGPQQQEAFRKTTAQISGMFGDAAPEFMKSFQEAALTPFGPSSEFSKELGRVAPELNVLYLNMAKMAGQGEDVTAYLQQFGAGLQNLSESQKQTLKQDIIMRTSLATGAGEITNVTSAIEGISLNKLNENLLDEPDKFSKSVNAISNLMGEIKARFSAIFAGFIENHQEFLNQIVDNLSKAAEFLLRFVEDMMNPEKRDKIFSELVSGVKSIVDTILHFISDYITQSLGLGTASAINSGKGNELAKKYDGVGGYLGERGFFGSAWDALTTGAAGIGSGLAHPIDTIGGGATAAGASMIRGVGSIFSSPAIQTPNMPAPINQSNASETSMPVLINKMDKLIDETKKTNDLTMMNVKINSKSADIQGDISRKTSANSNAIR